MAGVLARAAAEPAKHEQAEVDVMEVCANPPPDHNGNDVTLLHHYVHRIDGSHAFAIGSARPTSPGTGMNTPSIGGPTT